MSFLSLGPKAESYNPPTFGRLSSSRRTGFTICLTEIRRMSSVVRNEKEMLATVDGTEREIFMAVRERRRGWRGEFQQKRGGKAWGDSLRQRPEGDRLQGVE